MKATLATRIGVLLLVAASAVGAFMYEKKIALAPSRPAPASIVAGDRAAENDRRNPPGSSLEDRTSAAVGNAVEALTAILGDQTVQRTDPTDRSPAFDVARIEPSGEAVIAGRAAPGATVELLRAGELHDQTLANEAGEFVLVPRPLPPGNYALTLRSTQPDGQKLTSKGAVAVVLGPRKDDRRALARVGALKDDRPAVAPTGPLKDDRAAVAPTGPRKDDRPAVAPTGPRKDDRPAVPLAVPDNPVRAPAKQALAGAGLIAIDSVDTKPDGKLYVSGRSAADGAVRLYLNDAYIASATPSPEGRVAFVIESGVTPGDYRVQLEKVDPSGTVQSRTESSLKVPEMTFATASAPRSTPAFRRDGQSPVALSAGPTGAPSEVTENRPPRSDERALSRPADPAEVTENRPPRADESARPRLAEETKSQSAAAAAPGDEAGVVVVPKIETTVVAQGDNLWRISRITYGRGARYPIIFDANRDQIRKPHLIYPGQVFVLPQASDNEAPSRARPLVQ